MVWHGIKWARKANIWPKICNFGHFGPYIGLSGSFGAMPDQENNANEVRRWFSDMWVPELLLLPKMIRMLGPKTAIFALKYAFLCT